MGITIKNLTLLGKNDFAKVVGDVLRTLKVTVANREAVVNFDDMEIFNEIVGQKVITRLKVTGGGMQGCLRKFSVARADERFGAEANRLVKKNLYRLLVDNFGLDAVPYGILHGVRPTKIIQRWIDDGFGVTSQGVIDRDKIARRICNDFLAERDKAELLTEVAIGQLPIIRAVDAKTVSVYVGIPFCRTRCLYCSFPSNVLPADNEVAEFMTVLNRDIEAAANSIARYGLKVQTIYIGGGTPSALPEKFFAELLAKVHDSFNGAGVEEFTVECGRPDTITAEKISAMKNFGVTRVSVNPQTMHQRTLDIIGRQHTVADVERAFHELRAAGDWLINMDLIIGLPGERLADFAETLSKIIALKPDDVTIHTLAIKRGSKLQMRLADALNRLEDFDLPDDAEVRRMSEHAAKILRGEKFSPYYLYRQGYSSGQLENVGWCRNGAASVYNVQIMGERQTILGVGAAASTKVPDPVAKKILTSFNAKDLPIYLRDVERYIARRDEILSQVYSPVEVAEPVAEIQPTVEVTEPVAEIQPIVEVAEPVADIQPTVEVAEPVAKIQPTVEVAEPVADIQPTVEVAEPVADIQPTVEVAEPVAEIQPTVEVAEPVAEIQPTVEVAEPVAESKPLPVKKRRSRRKNSSPPPKEAINR